MTPAFSPPDRFARRALHRMRAVYGVVAALMGLSLLAGAARADAYGDVQQLHRNGQTTQALQQADAYIAKNPSDPQMRFVKAQLLSASGQADQALALLLQLTRDNPELPEPWNNLAVLYASRGQLEKAAEALQQALDIHPQYATALENLGAVRVQQAQQAWQRASQADSVTAARLAPRLNALRQLPAEDAPASPAPAPSPGSDPRSPSR